VSVYASNQAIELTTTRRVFTFQITKSFSLRARRGLVLRWAFAFAEHLASELAHSRLAGEARRFTRVAVVVRPWYGALVLFRLDSRARLMFYRDHL
jgi:hypothetical protein